MSFYFFHFQKAIAREIEAVLTAKAGPAGADGLPTAPSAAAQAAALPAASDEWATAWEEATGEAKRSEYAFRPSGMNRSYYTGYGMDMKDEPSDNKPK
jgi:hypothetical protein